MIVPSPRSTALVLLSFCFVGCKAQNSSLKTRASMKLEPCRLHPFPREMLCGELLRPRDAQDPQAGDIPIAVSVIESWGTRHSKAAPLFLIAGGPGQAARQSYTLARTAQLRRWSKHRDVVLVDIRGTGDSESIECDLEAPDDIKLSQSQLLERIGERIKVCRANMGETRKPHHYFTPVLADDLDAVREALGYESISLLGGSYGTRLAMEYARRHDAHTERVILDGVAPVQLALPWHYAQTFERAWNKIADYCEQDSACQARYPEFRSSLRQLITKLENAPPTTTSVNHTSRDLKVDWQAEPRSIRQVYFGPSYSASGWTLLPLAVDRALQGDWDTTFALNDGENRMSMHLTTTYSIVCNEDKRAWAQQDATPEMQKTLLGDVMIKLYQKICPAFTSEHPLPSSYFEPIKSDKPFLLLSGDADPVTPPTWAKKVQQNFPNALELTVPYTGHGTTSLPCVYDLVEEFLSSEAPLDIDTACVQETPRPVFFSSQNGPSTNFRAAQTLSKSASSKEDAQ